MRWARLFLGLLLLVALTFMPTATTSISPYTPTPKPVPTYERHVGNDESGFRRLQDQITDEENRRRSDDQEHRQRLTEHDRLIGGLIMQGNNTEKRMDRMEGWLFYIFMVIVGGVFTLIINTVYTVRTNWAVKESERREWDKRTERRKGLNPG